MFARYDQDLSVYFQRIRALERERCEERRLALRESWHSVLSLVGIRHKA